MIKDIFCHKGQYKLEDDVHVIIEGELSQLEKLTVKVSHLGEAFKRYNFEVQSELNLGPFDAGGYMVEIGEHRTAFDVVEKSTDYIRYGFLSEFYTSDLGDDEDVKQMNKYHINNVQFYDWMYRHDDLIPKTDEFIDPLGRKMNINAVKEKIDLCHRYGMKAVAYGAVYGAEREYFERYPEQLLYKNNGEKFDLIDIIGIMNIQKKSPWFNHIVNEFRLALTEMKFDGIHMDQYGFPKTAISGFDKSYVDLKEDFAPLIDATKAMANEIMDDSMIIFNCVNNWPIEYVKDANQDAVYVEVWDPHDQYRSLYNIVKEAKFLTNHSKNIILSAYVHPFNEEIEDARKEASALLAMSTIFASGANHLLLGEKNGALAEAYYVNYGKYSEAFEAVLRNYYDFIVMYEELLFHNELHDLSLTFVNGINDELKLSLPASSDFKKDTIATILKERKGLKVLNMVNLNGIENEVWNVGKTRPIKKDNIICQYMIHEAIDSVYFASPDVDNGKAIKLDYHYVDHGHGKALEFTVPSLDIWSMIFIKIKG